MQSKIVKWAAKRLESTKISFDKVEVWCSIQSILVGIGNVSKILLHTNKYKMRGERLRQLLNVENNNLLSNRKFWNAFEHYDERVEEYFWNQKSVAYIDLAINPSLSVVHNNVHRG